MRPRLADCERLKTEIAAQLKKWGVPSEINGYEGSDKNAVRQTAAALYACIRRYAFEKEVADISSPVEAGGGTKPARASARRPRSNFPCSSPRAWKV